MPRRPSRNHIMDVGWQSLCHPPLSFLMVWFAPAFPGELITSAQKVDSEQFCTLSQFRINLKTYPEKSQEKQLLYLLDETRRHMTTGTIGLHLGNKERRGLRGKQGRNMENNQVINECIIWD